MTWKLSLVCAVTLPLLLACPPVNNHSEDAGDEDSGEQQQGGCTGGCAVNQRCDEQTHRCVDGCGGCDAGVCVKEGSGNFTCVPQVTACNGTVCAQGQNTCVSGTCSCLGLARGAADSCSSEGMVCHETFNPVTHAGGSCEAPKFLEYCRVGGCPSGNCSACESAYSCSADGTELEGYCLKACNLQGKCDQGQLCSSNSNLCYPAGFFGLNCAIKGMSDAGFWPDGGAREWDGGYVEVGVAPANICMLYDGTGNLTGPPTANCDYAIVHGKDSVNPVVTCRPAGTVALYGACKTAFDAPLAQACGTGLTCMPTSFGEDGICLSMCNAADPIGTFVPQPSCGSDEACVNFHRFEDKNAVVGVCVKTCDLFSASSAACAAYGSVQSACVPTPRDGRQLLGTTGEGMCLPAHATADGGLAATGEPCVDTDPLRGAACATGSVCAPPVSGVVPVCQAVCDLDCAVASPPSKCASEPNAKCAGGKTCVRVTSTTGATLGLCR